MPERLTPIPLAFWRSASGREPVRDWLNELSRKDKKTIGRDIAKIKKTQRTPAQELTLAKQRLKEVQSWRERIRT